MTKIKLCGLRRLQDIEYANQVMPDYVGFVFADSRRQIGPCHAKILKEQLNPSIISVGVFVNEKLSAIADMLNSGLIDMAQLHGTETRDDIRKLKELTDKPVIKAVPVFDENSAAAWEGSKADYLLLDHGKGGTGHAFDWNLIGEIQTPYFLAGGINSNNLEEAMAVHPYAIDVSSGIETGGKKDREKMMEIVGRIRNEQR